MSLSTGEERALSISAPDLGALSKVSTDDLKKLENKELRFEEILELNARMRAEIKECRIIIHSLAEHLGM